jgi:predicted dehydrogenase
MRTPLAVGVVGATARAAALVRAFSELPQANLRWVCDERLLRRLTGSAEATAWTTELDDLIDDEELDAIVFASPGGASRGRARAALEAGKHVYIDGPLAMTSAEANDLVETAERRDRRLWAQSPTLLDAATCQLRALVERGALGEIFYLHARRYVQRVDDTSDLLWGSGAETVALQLHLLGDEPIEVSARDESYLGPRSADVFFGELRFATGIAAHIHLSCLEGDTVDQFSVVGSELTAVIDRGKPQRELSLYAVGDTARSFDGLSVEPGSAVALSLPWEDATRAACARFVTSVHSPGDAHYGREAAAVVAVLEALERSCRGRAEVETLTPPTALPEQKVSELRSR